MFYLETKDGERLFTEAHSDDKLEFEKILEAKLGNDAVDLFNQLLGEVEEASYNEGFNEGRQSEDNN